METIVKIKWDKPEEQNWLCPENIEAALSAYCQNTQFEVMEIPGVEKQRDELLKAAKRFVESAHNILPQAETSYFETAHKIYMEANEAIKNATNEL